MTDNRRGRAAVLGSGFAGLCAARALADHFDEVLVFERDKCPPDHSEARKGVPQGWHVHVLLIAGQRAVERLFPGFLAEVERRGAQNVDFADDMAWLHHGAWKQRYVSGYSTLMQSRPLIEQVVRDRLAEQGNVTVRYQTKVKKLHWVDGAVRGVVIAEGDQEPATIETDLVIDATGSGSQLPKWLEEAGYPTPPESKVGIGLGYTSRFYKRPSEGTFDWRGLMVYPQAPAENRGGVILPVEDGRWLVTLTGYNGDHPPTDVDGWLEYAKSLPHPSLAEALTKAEPLTDPRIYLVPSTRWRHFERCSRHPDGLVAVGDSICRFDPVFGQGMTQASLGATLLHDMLSAGRLVPAKYYAQMAKRNKVPWDMACVEDFRYPQAEGKRPFGLGFMQGYVRHVFMLSTTNPKVYTRFLGVLNLIKSPYSLFHPAVLMRVLGRIFTGSKPGPTEMPMRALPSGGQAPRQLTSGDQAAG